MTLVQSADASSEQPVQSPEAYTRIFQLLDSEIMRRKLEIGAGEAIASAPLPETTESEPDPADPVSETVPALPPMETTAPLPESEVDDSQRQEAAAPDIGPEQPSD